MMVGPVWADCVLYDRKVFMYFFVAILLTGGSIFELSRKKAQYKIYYIFLTIMTFMLCFRYGQGTDYFAYRDQFLLMKNNLSFFQAYQLAMHGEIGWYFLLWIMNRLSISFVGFIFILSFFLMLFTHKAIKEFSPYPIVSLLLLYPTFYLTYYYSALRQAIGLALFLGYGISFLTNKNYFKYVLLVLILTSFHSSAVVLLVVPFFLDSGRRRFLALACMIGALLGYTGFIGRMTKIVLGYGNYLAIIPSVHAMLVRLLYFIMIYLMHKANLSLESKIENTLYSIYFIGFFIFNALSFSSIISQRLTMPMKAVEILLIPLEISLILSQRTATLSSKLFNNKRVSFKTVTVLCMVLIVICTVPNVEFVKNIASYLVQSSYFTEIGVYEYPYLNIFNRSQIFKYRIVPLKRKPESARRSEIYEAYLEK